MNPTFKNPWDFIKWFCWEMIKTLSNEPSFFSSKRLERFGIFLNANILLDICVHELLVSGKIDYVGAIAIYTAQMIYAGYTMKQTFNEKPKTFVEAKKEDNVTSIVEQVTENVDNKQ